MTIILNGFPLKICGNDEQRQAFKIVILGLDRGIQGLFNNNTKDTNKERKELVAVQGFEPRTLRI